MRRPFPAFAFMLLASAGTGAISQASSKSVPTCADLHLVPAPRECTTVASVHIGESGVGVSASAESEDAFAAKDLKQTIATDDPAREARSGATVSLLRADSKNGKALLASHHLQLDAAMHEEGYVIAPDGPHGLAVIAETPAGIFYGAQTVRQLVHGTGKDAVLYVPTIRDWPAMPHRELSDDWSRGPLPSMDFLKREIRTLAAYKYNIFSPYFEHTFAYAPSPVAAFPGGAMTPAEGRELVAYAAQYHITIIPEQESFGHLHHVLKFEQFSPVGENPHGQVLAPG